MSNRSHHDGSITFRQRLQASFDFLRWKVQCIGPLFLIFALYGLHPVVASLLPMSLICLSVFYPPRLSLFDSKPILRCATSNLVGVTQFGMHSVTILLAIIVLATGLSLDRNWLALLLLAGVVLFSALTFGFDTPLRRKFDLNGLRDLVKQDFDE